MKGLWIGLIVVITNVAKSQGVSEKKDSVTIKIEANNQVLDSIICFGKSFIGLKYKYGGYSTSGFDCSGFLKFIFNKYGLALPKDSRSYAEFGEKIDSVDIQEIKKGDIMLFKGSNLKSKRIGHVSLVIDVNENEVLMLHSCRRGVIIDNYLDSDYYLKRFVGIRRIGLSNLASR